MSIIAKVRVPAKSYGKCSCGEKWHRDERIYVLKDDEGKDEKVCRFCGEDEDVEQYTQTEWEGMIASEQDEENHSERNAERERETYGAYLAAGCPNQYFEDMHG